MGVMAIAINWQMQIATVAMEIAVVWKIMGVWGAMEIVMD